MIRERKLPGFREKGHKLPPLSAVAAVLLSLLFSIVLISCAHQDKEKNNISSRKLTVTFEPQKWIVEQIAGKDFDVNVLLPPGSDPESYSPTVAQLKALYDSDTWLTLYTIGFEHSLLDNISDGESSVAIENVANGITPLEHSHGGLLSHHHEDDGLHDHDDHTDPHLWNSVKNMMVIAKNTLNILSKLNPSKEMEYRERYKRLSATLHTTDSVIAAALHEKGVKAFVIRHPSLAYFARDYGLEQIAIEAEGKEPSASQMKERIDKMRASGVSTIVSDSGKGDDDVAGGIAVQLNFRILPINTNSSDWHSEILKLKDL